MPNSDQKQISNANDWLSDHGQINYKELQELAQAGTSESLERLRGLADDNNLPYDRTTDPIQLAEEIYSATEKDANTGVE